MISLKVIVVMLVWVHQDSAFAGLSGATTIQGFNDWDACELSIPKVRAAYLDMIGRGEVSMKCVEMGR